MAKTRLELAAERIGKGDKAKTKQAFYRLQREDAEETGDQSTTDKIYKKMGKKSHSVDTRAVDKGILGSVAANAAIPELGAARALGGAARAAGRALPRAARAVESLGAKATKAAPRLVSKAKPVAQVTGRKATAIGARQETQRALPSSGHRSYEQELDRVSKKKVSNNPKYKAPQQRKKR